MSIGRPKIPPTEKKSEKIFVNLTPKQKQKLEQYAKKNDLSMSQVCLKALKKVGYI